MSLPSSYFPRTVSLEPVYLVRFKLQKLIQLRLGALIEVHNQVFPAPKNKRLHRLDSRVGSFASCARAQASSRIRTPRESCRQSCGKSQRLGLQELTMADASTSVSSVPPRQPPGAGLLCFADASSREIANSSSRGHARRKGGVF